MFVDLWLGSWVAQYDTPDVQFRARLEEGFPERLCNAGSADQGFATITELLGRVEFAVHCR
jgi:hypothetical protein